MDRLAVMNGPDRDFLIAFLNFVLLPIMYLRIHEHERLIRLNVTQLTQPSD